MSASTEFGFDVIYRYFYSEESDPKQQKFLDSLGASYPGA